MNIWKENYIYDERFMIMMRDLSKRPATQPCAGLHIECQHFSCIVQHRRILRPKTSNRIHMHIHVVPPCGKFHPCVAICCSVLFLYLTNHTALRCTSNLCPSLASRINGFWLRYPLDMCTHVWRCVAVCCSALQPQKWVFVQVFITYAHTYVALCCGVLLCVAVEVHYGVLLCVTAPWVFAQVFIKCAHTYTAVCCNVLQQ